MWPRASGGNSPMPQPKAKANNSPRLTRFSGTFSIGGCVQIGDGSGTCEILTVAVYQCGTARLHSQARDQSRSIQTCLSLTVAPFYEYFFFLLWGEGIFVLYGRSGRVRARGAVVLESWNFCQPLTPIRLQHATSHPALVIVWLEGVKGR